MTKSINYLIWPHLYDKFCQISKGLQLKCNLKKIMIPLFTNAANDKYMLLHEVALATTYVALLQNIDHNSLVNQGPY